LKSLAKENGGKYEWSTVGKIRDAMSVVYQHAQRHELVPAGVEHNPARARKFGGPKIKTKSGYKPVRVTPMQIKKMLDFLPLLQRTMVILCSLTAIRVSECVRASLVCHLLAGEQDLYPTEMAAGQDREAEDTRIGQLRCVDPSAGSSSGTLA
jgi:integrase